MSAAGFGNKDSKGNTLRTHADGPGFATPRPNDVDTSGPNTNVGPYKKRLNRAERRALARKTRKK